MDTVNLPASRIERLVAWCADRAWSIVLLGLALMVAVSTYAVRHFALTTNTYELLSPTLPWRVRETKFNNLFPQAGPEVVVVVDGQTPEITEAAAAALAMRLSAQPKLFHNVLRPDAGPFWAHNGLLYGSIHDVQETTAQLIKVEPFLGPMAADPSLRGLMNALSTALVGVNRGDASLNDFRKPMQSIAECLESLQAGKATFFSWTNLFTSGAPDKRRLRHVILIDPSLEFSQLQPGKASITAIREAAKALQLDPAHGVKIRLTGPVPLEDEELATLGERAPLIAGLALSAIVAMLWMAVRSAWLIIFILLTTLCGLVSTAALGLAIFHRFNVISVAFIPLFVGLGIDIGIQFSVRYRAERTSETDVRQALLATGRGMGRSLLLAATAIAVGFLAFGPTAYYGVSQLGIIAGLGMFVAFALNLTVLPALIRLCGPAGARAHGSALLLTKIDSFVLTHRRAVVGIGVGAAVASAAVLPLVQFDFNPLHLRSNKVESVATLYDLTSDPNNSANTLESIRPTLAAADAIVAKAQGMPEVASARSLSSFIPSDQSEKIAIIADAANLLDLTLNPLAVEPSPSDAEVIASLKRTAEDLRQAATSAGSDDVGDSRSVALRLAGSLERLASASAAARASAIATLMPGLASLLDQLRNLLTPGPVSLKNLPPELVRAWLAPDGRARVSISPKGDSNDNAVLSRFIAALTPIVPDATGTALSIQEGGRAVVRAFSEAGALSFTAITLLLFVALRRVRDVAITMAPIVLTGLLTMGSCVVIGQPLNFANIIALPLLFGIGVAFHIYFVMSWRSGGAHLLTSSLARAVFFSALATATGFGSLWASSHPGTASMGKLLMISLVWTLISALLFQPALMGDAPADRPAPAR